MKNNTHNGSITNVKKETNETNVILIKSPFFGEYTTDLNKLASGKIFLALATVMLFTSFGFSMAGNSECGFQPMFVSISRTSLWVISGLIAYTTSLLILVILNKFFSIYEVKRSHYVSIAFASIFIVFLLINIVIESLSLGKVLCGEANAGSFVTIATLSMISSLIFEGLILRNIENTSDRASYDLPNHQSGDQFSQNFVIAIGGKQFRAEEIIHAKADGNYLQIKLRSSERVHLVRSTFAFFIQEIGSHRGFIYCRGSWMSYANLRNVSRHGSHYEITGHDGTKGIISKRNRSLIKNLKDFLINGQSNPKGSP
jgi:hypothetical protein